MQSASSAHVCTHGCVPILGEIWADEKAELAALNAARSESPPTNWAGQHPVVLLPTPRTTDHLARRFNDVQLSDCYHLRNDAATIQHAAYRHRYGIRKGIWDCTEYRYDAQGRDWTRTYAAVTDDFGWLVEVPTC